jgi:hypothetical protein
MVHTKTIMLSLPLVLFFKANSLEDYGNTAIFAANNKSGYSNVDY